MTVTPLADALLDASRHMRANFHATPWAAEPALIDEHLTSLLSNAYGAFRGLDHSWSATTLDSLQRPRAALAEAQRLAAKAFGVDATFFVTGGSTLGNTVAVAATVPRNGRVLLDSSAHQSVHFAVERTTARIVAMVTKSGGIDVDAVCEQLGDARRRGEAFDAVVVSSSTYGGERLRCSQVFRRIAAADSAVRIVVDDAWCAIHSFGSHTRSVSPLCAIDDLRAAGCGNPVAVTQSAHKTMLAMRQGAYLHIAAGNDSELVNRTAQAMFTHHTTSPSWPILASLDIARAHAELEGHDGVNRLIQFGESMGSILDSVGAEGFTSSLPVVRSDIYVPDPLRICIRVPEGADAGLFPPQLWQRYGIAIPRVCEDRLVLCLTLGTQREALVQLAEVLPNLVESCTRRAACGSHTTVGEDDDERLAAYQFVVAYPPGVPISTPYSGYADRSGIVRQERSNGAEVFGIETNW